MWRMTIIYTMSFSIIVIGSIASAGDRAFGELIFIDHENLRYVEGSETTAFQISEIKRNIDEAKKYGIDGYLLFAKDMMEAMLTYDFDVPGIGNIGAKAFAPDSSHRSKAECLRKALREAMDYCKKKDVKLYFHSNQFIFKKEFLTAAAPKRIVCEFDAWREYTGHNYFPCYMGDEWAPRSKFLRQRGIPRVAVRLMWNSNDNPIFDGCRNVHIYDSVFKGSDDAFSFKARKILHTNATMTARATAPMSSTLRKLPPHARHSSRGHL